jgi:hypothetical protein
MSLSDLASVASIVQGVVVIISIIFVWYQLRESVKLTKAANTQKFVELSSPFNLQLIQDREMAKLSLQGNRNFEKLDEVDKDRYYNLLYWWLIHHENIYHQWRRKLIDEETFNSWTRDLEYFITTQQLGRRWSVLQRNFEHSFVTHVSQIIKELDAKLNNQPI